MFASSLRATQGLPLTPPGLYLLSPIQGESSQLETIFGGDDGSGLRKVWPSNAPIPRGWIQWPESLGLAKMGTKARQSGRMDENWTRTPAWSWWCRGLKPGAVVYFSTERTKLRFAPVSCVNVCVCTRIHAWACGVPWDGWGRWQHDDLCGLQANPSGALAPSENISPDSSSA